MDMCQKSDLTTSRIIDRRPFVTIEVGQGKSVRTVRALIDSGAATSAVRLSHCQDLQLDINPIEAYLIGLGGVETPCLDEVELPIYLQDVPMKVKMLVCHDEDLTEPLVLGQDWIYDHAVNLNLRSQLLQVWVHEQCITLELDNCMLTDHGTTHSLSSSKTNLQEQEVVCVQSSMFQKNSIMEEQARRQANSSSCSKTKAVTTTQAKKQVTQPTRTAISNTKTTLKKKETPCTKQIWVRKGEQPTALPQQFPSKWATHAKRSSKKQGQAQPPGLRQIWVPKKLVAAQQGRLQMWVPKKLLHTQRPMLPTMLKDSAKKPRREKGKNRAQRPKEDKLNPLTKVRRQSSRIWVRKPKVPVASTTPKNELLRIQRTNYSEMDSYKEDYIIARFSRQLQTKTTSSLQVTSKALTSNSHVPLA
ncbi:hypothetical protein KP509_12G057200 [Ceratopteris richardii]|uniref:Peptidase A2 domain-containing protein n=2 Tax=Ceratopteris richardii TaxID=49495 RepID=A0A8T2TM33_CERRI|nr:hypothetical protein KP509_12G057200 [Ceratopteris richardii]